MAANAVTMNEMDHRAGTTWCGYALTILDNDGSPIDLTDAVMRIMWRDGSDDVVMDWTLGDGIELDGDPTAGTVLVHGPGVIDVAPGRLRFDFKIWMPSGEVFVDIDGAMIVVKGITREKPE